MNKQERIIERYLLGELPESEQDSLEREFFSDQRLFEQFVQVENELVDKYARGLLPATTRERFEKHYLAHPNRRERTRFAEVLAARVDQIQEIDVASGTRERWLDRLIAGLSGPKLLGALATLVLLIAIATSWALIETRRLRRELATAQSERVERERLQSELQQQITKEQERTQKLSEEIERLQAEQTPSPPITEPKAASKFATLILTIGGSRAIDSNQPVTLVIPAGTEEVKLQLRLQDNQYPSYRVVIQSANSNTVFTSRRVTTTGPNLSLLIPARLFSSGDYIVTFKGFSKSGEAEDLSKSLIRVERR